MKKLKFIPLFLIALVNSCGANPQNYFNELLDKVQIGMSESDFKLTVEGEQLIKASKELTVYKVEKKSYNDLHGWRKDYRFFYFTDNKLVQIDQGQRAVDYRVKID